MKFLPILITAVAFGSASSAATTGFELQIYGAGDNNVPTVRVENTGDLGEITGFGLTIGDAANYNLDGVGVETGSFGVTATLTSGDYNLSGGGTSAGRYTTIGYTTSNFGAGAWFSFTVDVDSNYVNDVQDYRDHLLPGGLFSITFAGGLQTLFNVDLTATPGNDSAPYTYTGSVSTAAVPLPAGLPLLLSALGGAALLSRRKKQVS